MDKESVNVSRVQEELASLPSVADENPSNGIISWLDANLNTDTIYKIPYFGVGTDYWLMTQMQSGGVCAPTAGTNVLWYWGKQCGRSSIMNRMDMSLARTNLDKAKVIFKKLYTGMQTDPTTGTPIEHIMDGFAYFFNEPASATGKWNYREIWSTSFSPYMEAVAGQCPVLLGLSKSYIPDGGTQLKGWGHAVFCFGYAYSVSGEPYLFVMDGWRDGGKFVRSNYYTHVYGYKVYVR